MAGDWIKVERATLHKPEILEAAELLGMKRREALGLFLDYFAWLDENMPDSCNGFVTHVSRMSVDETLHAAGFAAVLEAIGWAKFDDAKRMLTVIHHERHNGKTAKSRALATKRVQRFRNDGIVTESLPEKRREVLKYSAAKSTANGTANAEGFAAFWAAYPKKKNKGDALKAWVKLGPDQALCDLIVSKIDEQRGQDPEWTRDGGQYIPHPASWLNARGWEDEFYKPKRSNGLAL
jgi:hypothetical protein